MGWCTNFCLLFGRMFGIATRHAQEIDYLCLSSQEVIALDEIFR